MSFDPIKATQSSKSASGSLLAAAATGNPNLHLEKLGLRTSTPDSEALVSSDDEGEHRQDASPAVAQPPKPVRRSSWLNDTSIHPIPRPRKGSFASNSVSSPTTSHPSTPSAENGPVHWNPSSAMNRNQGPGFSWGTGIWNNDRKDASARLGEVLPSPTSLVPPGGAGNSFFGSDAPGPQTSPSRESGGNAQIPFAIPLHPTPKTYRSQSYSVGQMEPEIPPPGSMASSAVPGRARYPALQHRPSRPSMLSEMANEGSMLGKVKEVEDDDDEGESPSGSMHSSFHQSAESKTIEMLTRENAMLRQQQQQLNARIRPRAATGSSFVGNGYPTVPEESDYAVDELDENHDGSDYLARRGSQRRMSEYGANHYRTPLGMDKSKIADNPNLKKALWSSSPGLFGGDASQSRRHSFANMPTRQGSISSVADSVANLNISEDTQSPQSYGSGYPEVPNLSAANAAYFNPSSVASNPQHLANSLPPTYGMPPQFTNRPTSPHRGAYGLAQPRPNQLLHVVLFKCARADVFYIHEGTGLTVKPGDLVIVEADRGTDLGTVAKDNVDWQTAKDLKEHYAEEQYKWLMMYSQGAAAAQDGSGGGLLAAAGLPGSAIGGMGPANQQHMQEPANGELRPKMIKRLAQQHEIQALRDKEGQEAKAKRMCMQKVKEHGLNMEILDAEFQMDWKKLTFYYFADAYINFNSLVTDLFKIYKTRIWMSAINPASFASPTLGIQAPSGVGPGAVGIRGSGGERRQNATPQEHPGNAGPGFAPPPNNGGRGYRQGFQQPMSAERSAVSPVSGPPFPPSNYAFGPGAGYGGPGGRHQGPYGVNPSPTDPYSPQGFQHGGDFHAMRQRFGPGQAGPGNPHPHAQRLSPISPQGEWNPAFQGLSLNSH